MDPTTIMIGSMVVSSLAQLYNSEKARGANTDQLNQIKSMFDQIKPPDYDVSIDAPPELHQQALQSPKFSDPAMLPKFNMNAITPDLLKVVGQQNPEIPAFVQQAAPQLIKNTADMGTARAAQLKALQRYTDISNETTDPIYQQQVQQASQQAQQQAQSRLGAIQDQYRRQGTFGSGLELASKLGASADMNNTIASANQSAAATAYQNRLNALTQGANIGSAINSQDTNQQQANANIINDFNNTMANRQTNYNTSRANLMNQAQANNLANAQGLANQNTNNANAAKLQDQARNDALSQYTYGAQVAANKNADQNAQQTYQNGMNNQNYENQIAQYIANWNAAQKNNANNLKTSQYNNAMNNASGKAGIYAGVGQNAIQNAQDQNAAIGGLGQAGFIYGANQLANENQQKANALARGQQVDSYTNQANLAKYRNTGNFMTPDEMNQYRSSMGGQQSNYYKTPYKSLDQYGNPIEDQMNAG